MSPILDSTPGLHNWMSIIATAHPLHTDIGPKRLAPRHFWRLSLSGPLPLFASFATRQAVKEKARWKEDDEDKGEERIIVVWCEGEGKATGDKC